MLIVRNTILPVGKKYAAINLFGVFFVKKHARVTPRLLNHEKIHTRQMLEMLFVPFYIMYLLEWTVRLFQYRFNPHEAYRNISFEREAYANERDLHYLARRPGFAQYRHYLKNKT